MLAMGVTERSETAHASPLVLVQKADANTYSVCINFKELNNITVFDPQTMSPDEIFGGVKM